MKFENTPFRNFICACLKDRECIKEVARRLGVSEFLAVGYLVLAEFVPQAYYRGQMITISPERVSSMVEECGIDTRTVMRASKKLLRMHGVFPEHSNYAYNVVKVAKVLDAVRSALVAAARQS